jgi:hypothetical protein
VCVGGVVWCGVVWCGVVWCGVVWCGVVGVVGVVSCGDTSNAQKNNVFKMIKNRKKFSSNLEFGI